MLPEGSPEILGSGGDHVISGYFKNHTLQARSIASQMKVEELLKLTESKILSILEAMMKMDMVEIRKGGKYKVISRIMGLLLASIAVELITTGIISIILAANL